MPLDLTDVRSGYGLSAINDNFQKIEEAWDEKLDRIESTQGNQMQQNLDMNGYRLLNAYVGDTNLSNIGEDLEQAVEDAEAAASSAMTAASQASASATNAAASAASAKNNAEAAEAAADRVTGLTSLPVIEWQQGLQSTVSTQRYLYDGVLFIAPSATESNPVPLGASPIGDPNWIDWSTPVYFFSLEEVLTVDTLTLTLPESFLEVSDVYVNGLLQESGSYTVDTSLATLTFDETIPAGTFVKVWTGRPRDAVLTDYAYIQEVVNSVGVMTDYTSGALASATDVLKPGVAFNKASVSIDGVNQVEGVAFNIEEDDTDPLLNQLRFTEQVPAGSYVSGLLRSV